VTYGLSLGAVAIEAAVCPSTGCASVGEERALAIPGVGPFVQMVWTTNPIGNVVLALDGLAQMGGIAMLTIGLVMKQEAPAKEADAPRFTFVPLVGSGRYGMGLGGTF
jgi:hypothetical protein